MNGWDCLILLVFVLQIAAVVAIVIVALRLKRGPVDKALVRVRRLASSGKGLAATGGKLFADNRERVAAIAGNIGEIRASFSPGAGSAAFAAEPMSYARVTSAVATLKAVRKGLKVVKTVRARGVGAAVIGEPKAARTPRRSMADRLGLIPPAARHLGPILRVARVAWNVRRELRARGVL
jgi:hypothetical protein